MAMPAPVVTACRYRLPDGCTRAGIKSLYWIRDTRYREDRSIVRTRSGPRVLASLRIL